MRRRSLPTDLRLLHLRPASVPRDDFFRLCEVSLDASGCGGRDDERLPAPPIPAARRLVALLATPFGYSIDLDSLHFCHLAGSPAPLSSRGRLISSTTEPRVTDEARSPIALQGPTGRRPHLPASPSVELASWTLGSSSLASSARASLYLHLLSFSAFCIRRVLFFAPASVVRA